MRSTFLATLLAFAALCATAFSRQVPDGGTIEGIVVRSDTGAPIPEAKVTLSSSIFPPAYASGQTTFRNGHFEPNLTPGLGSRPVVAASDGKFSFAGLAPGTYFVAVTSAGFSRREYGQRTPSAKGKPIYVGSGQTVRLGDLRLLPESAVIGRVFDEKGQPAPNAYVQLLRVVYGEDGKGYRLVQEVMTDDQGRYRVFGILPGRYYLGAGTFTPTSFRSPRETITGAPTYRASYYPRAASLEAASVIEVGEGREDSFDLTVTRQPEQFRVRGRVIDAATGQPPAEANATLFVTQFRGGVSSGQRSNYDPATGTFQIEKVSPGNYDLMFAPPFSPSRSFRPPLSPEETLAMELEYSAMRRTILHVQVGDADVEGLVVSVSKANSAKGRFLIEEQFPTAVADLTRARISMRIAGIDINEPATVLPTAADGSFEVRVRDGEYRITVSGIPDGFYVKQIQYDGKEVTNTIKVSDPLKGPIDVILRHGAVQLAGTVKDAESTPVPGAEVVLLAVERGRHRDAVVFADQAGRFVLNNVPPGDYRLYGWDSVEEGAYYDPEFMKAYAGQGQLVRVVESANQSLDVKLLP